ncbi:response regulator [bacterium M00.F.Ca.ET.228.01.1.1]|nr:response regulator [bacterium M00.F.Ca.ET.228.01.1.1]TGR96450.1 response regulator [bacterium M00.F.Ca.ET.191.01.1.1]TGT97686.1 response regulator [bacterium M00.F.Ca.ET.155.01.1.1]
MKPEESLAIAERVKSMLRRHGIADRKQAAQLSMLLEISPQSAYKKLGGQMQWSLDDIVAIASAMGERAASLLDDSRDLQFERAVLRCNGWEIDCMVKAGPPPSPICRPEYLALREHDRWCVYPAPQAPVAALVAIQEIVIRPTRQSTNVPRIAIVDDDADTAELIAMVLEGKGFKAVTLTGVEELSSRLQVDSFDGFIIDWYLGGATAADCVRLIRRTVGEVPPILLLTGNIDTGLANESDITDLMREFGLKHPFEKPYRVEIIAAELIKSINDAAKGNSQFASAPV